VIVLGADHFRAAIVIGKRRHTPSAGQKKQNAESQRECRSRVAVRDSQRRERAVENRAVYWRVAVARVNFPSLDWKIPDNLCQIWHKFNTRTTTVGSRV
jgi:hypothetical protein